MSWITLYFCDQVLSFLGHTIYTLKFLEQFTENWKPYHLIMWFTGLHLAIWYGWNGGSCCVKLMKPTSVQRIDCRSFAIFLEHTVEVGPWMYPEAYAQYVSSDNSLLLCFWVIYRLTEKEKKEEVYWRLNVWFMSLLQECCSKCRNLG